MKWGFEKIGRKLWLISSIFFQILTLSKFYPNFILILSGQNQEDNNGWENSFFKIFSKYSNEIFVQNGASAPFRIYMTCRFNLSNYLEGNSWLIKRINFLWRWLPLSLPFQRYSGTGPDLLLGFGWFGGKPIVGFTEPIIGFTCGSLFELLFGFYLKFYK